MAKAEAEADTSSSTSDTLTGSSKLRFSEDEETLINRMFNLVGQRWGLIAGRINEESLTTYSTNTLCKQLSSVDKACFVDVFPSMKSMCADFPLVFFINKD
uniref:Uncharacterized protein n=1 Tax=Kalanchoe fedtschenkoi TaxID=63787 RepID=A0A7N0TGL8_KALFE